MNSDTGHEPPPSPEAGRRQFHFVQPPHRRALATVAPAAGNGDQEEEGCGRPHPVGLLLASHTIETIHPTDNTATGKSECGIGGCLLFHDWPSKAPSQSVDVTS